VNPAKALFCFISLSTGLITISCSSIREWNKRQKLQDIENIKPEKKPRIKLSKEDRKQRAKEFANRWRENNKERCEAR